MYSQATTKSQLVGEYSTTTTNVTNLTCYVNDTYEAVIRRFRIKVPQLDVSRLRAATRGEDILQVLGDANSPSGFVLFAEYNHAGWMRHFVTQVGALKRAHRFTFGNPLFALPVLQGEIEAALRIPLDCCFVEESDSNRTKLVVTLPTTVLETSDDGVQKALAEIEAKLFALIQDLQLQA